MSEQLNEDLLRRIKLQTENPSGPINRDLYDADNRDLYDTDSGGVPAPVNETNGFLGADGVIGDVYKYAQETAGEVGNTISEGWDTLSDWVSKSDKNKEFQAATKNNISLRQLKELREKSAKKGAKESVRFGTISELSPAIKNENFANQVILDKNIKDKLGDGAQSKEIDLSGLDLEKQREIANISAEIDPTAALIESEYGAEAALRDGLMNRRQVLMDRGPQGDLEAEYNDSYGDNPTGTDSTSSSPVSSPQVPAQVPAQVPTGKDLEEENKYSYGGNLTGTDFIGTDPVPDPMDDLESQNAVRKEMKDLNTKILDPGTSPVEKEKALKFRKEAYAPFPPRERALAKEETGNYWIDPISGVAINIDAIEADGKRKSNWLMIDKMPDHAKPYFMAKFGYLDEEDVDGMPMDPKLKVAEMQMQIKKLEIESQEKMQVKSVAVQYAAITGKQTIADSELRWRKESYNTLSAAQQQDLQMKVHTQIRADVALMFENGQYEPGMLLAQGLNIPYVHDPKAFWASKAKKGGMDSTFLAAFNSSGMNTGGLTAKDAAKNFYTHKSKLWTKLIEPNKDAGLGKASYFEAQAADNGYVLWDGLSEAQRIGSTPLMHHNKIRARLFNDLLATDPMYSKLHKSLNDEKIAKMIKGNSGGTETGTGTGTGTGVGTGTKTGVGTGGNPISNKLDPAKQAEKLLTKNPDNRHDFGGEAYTNKIETTLLKKLQGKQRWLQKVNKKGLRVSAGRAEIPEKDRLNKLAKSYKTGKAGFKKLIAEEREKKRPSFLTLSEAVAYFNENRGFFNMAGARADSLRNDVKYYMSMENK